MNSQQFERQLLEVLADFEPALSVENGAHRIAATKHPKSALVVWPYSLAEVFLDFSDHGEVVFSESVEYYDEEPREEQLKDIARVLRNFLLNETRVSTVGRLLSRSELQFRQGDKWISVFQSSANET